MNFVVRHSNWLNPEDYFRFIHLGGFTSDWNDLKLNDDDLAALEIQLMLSPQQGSVISGTGGVRKVRFSPPSWNQGKRGALRVLYAIFPDFSVAVLAAIFSKSEKGNINADDKKMLKQLMHEIQRYLEHEVEP